MTDRPSSRDLVHGGVHGPGILVLSSSKKELLLIFRSWTALLPSFNTNCVRENAVLIDQWEKIEFLCIYLWTHGHLDVDDNTLAPQKIFRGKWRHLRPCIRLDRLKFELNNQDLRGETLLSCAIRDTLIISCSTSMQEKALILKLKMGLNIHTGKAIQNSSNHSRL